MDPVENFLKAYLKVLEDHMLIFNKQGNKSALEVLMKESVDVRKAIKMWKFRDYYKIDEEKWRKDHKKGGSKNEHN